MDYYKGHSWENCSYFYDVCRHLVIGQCMIEHCQFSGLTNMLIYILCFAPKVQRHNIACLEGRCNDCGIEVLVMCPIEEDATCTKLMQLKCYEYYIHGKL